MSITLLCLIKGNIITYAFAVDIDREKLSFPPETTTLEQSLIETIKDLKFQLFIANMDSKRRPSSVYNYVKKCGDVQIWQIEKDIDIEPLFSSRVFIQYPNAPAQGIDKIKLNQLFCKDVVQEVVRNLYLENELVVLGDYGIQEESDIYADIIIGYKNYYQELTNYINSPPDLSKGLG
ncbi:hypothetical protein RclHR1_01020027 [Rhizophagus clarus]|uniref:Endonuclease/exonuclease/phosphatase domain-containing protein n=1 Tax=Rhizophagus clarus TaxID=94130 RepID=A0A2Z6QT11_9GLOM|nr:hypothetical protein RclHR1_01020027 [Rhizophagus clarus]